MVGGSAGTEDLQRVWANRDSGGLLCVRGRKRDSADRERFGGDWAPHQQHATVSAGWKAAAGAGGRGWRVVYRRGGTGAWLSAAAGVDGGALPAASVQ